MQRRAITSAELVDVYLARIEAYDRKGPRLNAIVAVNPKAREEAAALDCERATQGSARPAPRHSARPQGQLRPRRHADDRRHARLRHALAGRRCVPGEEAARRGRGDPGEGQPAGARVGNRHRELARRADQEPVRPAAQSRRIERRHRRGGRREPRGRGSGQRHLRIDPHSGLAQRARRPPQQPWPLQPRRGRAALAYAGHRRTARADRDRRRDPARRDRGIRSGGSLDQGGRRPHREELSRPAEGGRAERRAHRRSAHAVRHGAGGQRSGRGRPPRARGDEEAGRGGPGCARCRASTIC